MVIGVRAIRMLAAATSDQGEHKFCLTNLARRHGPWRRAKGRRGITPSAKLVMPQLAEH